MSEYIDFKVGESNLVMRWFRQAGMRKFAKLMKVSRYSGELETVSDLSVEQAEMLSEVTSIGDDDLHREIDQIDLDDDEQAPVQSTEPAIEPYEQKEA